jgi:hypothetical protein
MPNLDVGLKAQTPASRALRSSEWLPAVRGRVLLPSCGNDGHPTCIPTMSDNASPANEQPSKLIVHHLSESRSQRILWLLARRVSFLFLPVANNRYSSRRSWAYPMKYKSIPGHMTCALPRNSSPSTPWERHPLSQTIISIFLKAVPSSARIFRSSTSLVCPHDACRVPDR